MILCILITYLGSVTVLKSLNVVIMSPELATSDKWIKVLKHLDLVCVALDEVHVIDPASGW